LSIPLVLLLGWWFPELPGPEHGCFDSNVNVCSTWVLPGKRYAVRFPARNPLSAYAVGGALELGQRRMDG